MKKLFSIVMAVMCAVFTGCDKELPTVEQMTKVADTAGVTAGTVANLVKIDDVTRNVVIDIVGKVELSVPTVGQKFEDAWTPIAKMYVDQLITEGKLDEAKGKLVLSAFGVAVKGIDYLVFIKYKDIGTNLELVEAAAHGFCGGYLRVFKPVNGSIVGAGEIDKELYDYLTK